MAADLQSPTPDAIREDPPARGGNVTIWDSTLRQADAAPGDWFRHPEAVNRKTATRLIAHQGDRYEVTTRTAEKRSRVHVWIRRRVGL